MYLKKEKSPKPARVGDLSKNKLTHLFIIDGGRGKNQDSTTPKRNRVADYIGSQSRRMVRLSSSARVVS